MWIDTHSHEIAIAAAPFVYSSQAPFSSRKLSAEFRPPTPAADAGEM